MKLSAWISTFWHRLAPVERGERPLRLALHTLEDRLAPATLTVNTLTDSTLGAQLSLRDALVAINAGTYAGPATGQVSGTFGDNDTILFQAGLNGTLPLQAAKGPLLVAKNVTLMANPAANAITISGQNATGVVQVTGATTATLAGLTITQGKDSTNLFGGITIASGANVTINGCTFVNNQSMGSGGGAILNAGTLTVTNSTFNTNSGVVGGAISNLSGATATLLNCTIAGNQATSGAGTGGGVANAGTLTLLNTLIAQNKTAGTAPDVAGAFISAGHNLIGNTTGSTGFTENTNGDQVGTAAPFTGNLTAGLNTIENVSSTAGLRVGQLVTDAANSLPAGTVIKLLGPNTITLSQVASTTQTGITLVSAVNAKLGPLQNNGGGIQTMALLPLSTAIDAGANSDLVLPVATTDQRGTSRPQAGTVDIGAFEARQILVTNLDDSGAGSLRDALAQSNSTPGTVLIDFQEGLAGTLSLTSSRLEVVHDNWIRGPGAAQITIDGNNSFWCFGVNSQYTVGSPGLYVAIDGLTLTKGRQVTGLSDTRGGAISYRNSFPFPSILSVVNCVINSSTNGGIYAEDRLSISNTKIHDNTGHGLNINGDYLDVTDSWFANNTSNGINADVHAVLTNTTLSGNGSNAIRNGNANQLLTNCTVTENAKGVEVSLDDIGRYINCTIVGNTTEDARTVVGNGVGDMRFANSILGKMVVQFGGFTSQGYNLFTRGFPDDLQTTDVVTPIISSLPTSSGGSLVGGTYYYQVTAITEAGSVPSVLYPVTVSTNQKVTVNWIAPEGTAPVTGYQIYRGQTPATMQLIATVPDSGTYVDTGAAGSGDPAPLLRPLADNGGPTPTMAVTASGRDAIGGQANAALSPLFDQRGILRNPVFPDVGAYQSTSPTSNTLTLTPSTLPGVGVGMSYSQLLTATGGTGTGYLFGVTAGTLPTGFTLDLNGQLVGTASALGSFTFTVTCFDSAGNVGQRVYTLQVNPPPSILTTTLPDGAENVAYNAAIDISGGTAPFTWDVNGTLPDGVTFDTNTGTFGGSPTMDAAGVYDNIEVTVTDTYGGSAMATYSITVQWAIVLNPTLPAVTLNTPYSHSQTITGGSGSYSGLNVTGLPDGLTAALVGTTLTVSGTPTATGTFPLSIAIHDDGTNTDSLVASASLTVNPALVITTPSLPNWTESLPYEQTINTTGGTGPLTFEISAGTLPTGLSLDEDTGVISGTPAVGSAGDYAFTVMVTDASGAVETQAYNVTISNLEMGALSFQQWTQNKTGFIGTIPVQTGNSSPTVEVISGALPTGLTSAITGNTITFAGTPTTVGVFTFTLELSDGLGGSTNATYTIEIQPATTLVWTGLGGDAQLMTPGNWAGSVAPQAGNTLLFGGGAATGQTTANNNFPAGTTWGALRFTDAGFTLTGNDVILTTGIHSTSNVGGTNTVGLNIALTATSTFTIDGTTMTNLTGILSGKKLGLVKTGPGTLALGSATGHTYTGLTTVNGGTLQLSGSNQLLDTGAIVVNAGAELALANHDETIANVTLVGGTITTGTGTLVVSKALTTNAANTAALIDGQLHLTSKKPTLTVADGAAVDDLVLAATLTATGLTKAGLGTLAFTGNNGSYTGTTTVKAGGLTLPNPAALGSGPLVVSGKSTVQIEGDGLTFTNPLMVRGKKAILANPSGDNAWAGPITNAGTSLVDVASDTLTLTGPISGGGLTKNGTGTLILPNANTYKGKTTVNAGVLELPNAAAISSTAAVTVAGTATLFLNGTGLNFNRTLNLSGLLTSPSGTNTWSGKIKTTGTTSTVNIGAGHTLTLSGAIGGSGGLTKSGSGSLVLSGASSYKGTTTLAAGVTTIQNAKALGAPAGATVVTDGATLQLNGDLKVAEKLTLNGVGVAGTTGALQSVAGNSAWTGPITLATASTIAVDAGHLTLGGKIDGSGSLNLVGAGELTLAAIDTSTGGTTVTVDTFKGGGTVGSLLVSSGTTFAVQMNSLKAGKGYDQLNVMGTVDVTDATLDLDLGFTPLVGSTFTLIENDGTDAVVGTFAGYAEGTTFQLSGLTFQISYLGGTGNDVVLTRTA